MRRIPLLLGMLAAPSGALAQGGGGRTGLGGGGDIVAAKIMNLLGQVWKLSLEASEKDNLVFMPATAVDRISRLLSLPDSGHQSGVRPLEIILEPNLYLSETKDVITGKVVVWRRLNQIEYFELQHNNRDANTVIRIVDAVAEIDSSKIFINSTNWHKKSLEDQMQLLFHELLWFAGINEYPHYNISTALMVWRSAQSAYRLAPKVATVTNYLRNFERLRKTEGRVMREYLKVANVVLVRPTQMIRSGRSQLRLSAEAIFADPNLCAKNILGDIDYQSCPRGSIAWAKSFPAALAELEVFPTTPKRSCFTQVQADDTVRYWALNKLQVEKTAPCVPSELSRLK